MPVEGAGAKTRFHFSISGGVSIEPRQTTGRHRKPRFIDGCRFRGRLSGGAQALSRRGGHR